MNQHLNLFRYFNESTQSEFLENNLSRAFALCLKHDVLFFSKYIYAVAGKEDYDYLFSRPGEDIKFEIDLQKNTADLETTGYKKVYAVAMTAEQNLDMSGLLLRPASVAKENNFTDVLIQIKDYAFVIEVKRTKEDCRQQLYNQVAPFMLTEPSPEIIPVNFSWIHTVHLMEQVVNINKLRGGTGIFIDDFLSLSELRYSNWYATIPFSMLAAPSAHIPLMDKGRWKRLVQVVGQSKQQVLDYSDRMALSINFGWASEVIPEFQTRDNEDYLRFAIWPGNTKGQGRPLYSRSLDWTNKTHLTVRGRQEKLDIKYHLKFCHFNRYISSLSFTDNDILRPVNTKENFSKSGRWPQIRWHEFEAFLDGHFKTEFNWREQCGYERNFTDTERTYFTVSFGFMAELLIPYHTIQELDKNPVDCSEISSFVDEIILSFAGLLE